MTHNFPPGPLGPPGPPPNKLAQNWWLTGGIAAGALTLGLLTGVVIGTYTANNKSTPTASSNSSGSGISVAEAPPAATAPEISFTPEDFRVDVLLTEQKCYGSAGCTCTYTVDPNYVGSKQVSEASSKSKFTVVFEILGGTETQTGNFRSEGDGVVKFDKEARIDCDPGATLSARVVRVINQ